MLWSTGEIHKSAWQTVLDRGFERKVVSRIGRSMRARGDREIMNITGWINMNKLNNLVAWFDFFQKWKKF